MGGKQDKDNHNNKLDVVTAAISSSKRGEPSKKSGFKLKKHFSRNNSPMAASPHRKPSAKTSKSAAASSATPAAILLFDSGNRNAVEKVQPSRYAELFENEKDSDVTFLVGMEPTIWRLPAHKFVLVAANPVFAAMLKGPMSSKDDKEEVPIEDLDPKAFENVLRFLYTNGLKLTSIDLALATLFAAEKYMITELIQLCLQHLEVNLTTSSVLSIYPRIRLFASSRLDQLSDSLSSISTASSYSSSSFAAINNNIINAHQEQFALLTNPYIPLMNRCLEHIDRNAEPVLILEDFEGLSQAELCDIVFRDTLQLKSELSIFKALQVWATQQCKFKQMEMTGENKRKVLGSALYAVRYLLMSKEDFMLGPYVSNLLSKEEKSWFLKRIEGHSECEPPHHIADRKRYFERKRGQHVTLYANNENIYGRDHELQSHLIEENNSRKRCCRVTKIFTEVFLCFSLFFD